MAHRIDFSFLDFDNAGMTLSFPATVDMLQATFTGPLSNVVVAPGGGSFTLNKAQLDTIGFAWGADIDIDITMADTSVQNYEFTVDGTPPLRIQSIADGAVTPEVDIVLNPSNALNSVTFDDLLAIGVGSPLATQLGLRFTVDNQFAGDSLGFKAANSQLSLSKTISGSGSVDLIFSDTVDNLVPFTDNMGSIAPFSAAVDLEISIGGYDYDWTFRYGQPAGADVFRAEPIGEDGSGIGIASALLVSQTPAANTLAGNPVNPGEEWDGVYLVAEPGKGTNFVYENQATAGITYFDGVLANVTPLGLNPDFGSVIDPVYQPAWHFEGLGVKEHLRNKEIKFNIGNTGWYLIVEGFETEILIAAYDDNSGQWYYSDSGVPDSEEYTSEHLIPGAIRDAEITTINGGAPTNITHWAVCPIRGQMSAINYSETIEVDSNVSGALSKNVDLITDLGGVFASFRERHYGVAFEQGVEVDWPLAFITTIVVDTGNLSGLGSSTYSVEFK